MVYNTEEEKLLIERFKNGDSAAFDGLVEVYQRKGFAIAYNMTGNCEDAKDILQEAFIKVYCNIKGFNGKSSFFTWFYRIVVNCALDCLRKRGRSHLVFSEASLEDNSNIEPIDPSDSPQQALVTEELNRKLDQAVEQLSEKQKVCFLLKHRNGLKNKEIADILGCGLSTVKSHLFRAVNTLQSKLSSVKNSS